MTRRQRMTPAYRVATTLTLLVGVVACVAIWATRGDTTHQGHDARCAVISVPTGADYHHGGTWHQGGRVVGYSATESDPVYRHADCVAPWVCWVEANPQPGDPDRADTYSAHQYQPAAGRRWWPTSCPTGGTR